MPLDEISEASPKSVAQTAYSLFNGQGKLQGAKEGGNRKALKWQVANLSTGEEDLESYLAHQGIKVNAGQLVRLLNIPMKKATNFHELADGKTHADTLNGNAMQFYGAFGCKWIEWLIASDKSELRAFYEAVKQNRLATLYVFKSVFELEALAGQSKEIALPVLVKAKMLKEGNEKSYKYLNKIPSRILKERPRAYLVAILDEANNDEAD